MKTFITLFWILIALNGLAQSSSNCMIHHYQFDGNYDDVTSNKNHLTNYGATLVTDRFGKDSAAVHITGGQYLEGGIDSLPYDKSPRTVALWMYLDLNPDSDVPLVYGSTSPAGAYGIIVGTNLDFVGQKAMRHFAWGMSADHGFLLDYPVKKWFHMAITYDGDTAKTYMDGKLEASSARNWTTKKNKFLIGKNLNSSSNDMYNGSIDDVRIYGCALTESEIADLAKTSTMGISDISITQVKIYPNPGLNFLNVEAPDFPIDEIVITNTMGQIMYLASPTLKSHEIQTSDWALGIYSIAIKQNNKLHTMKWIKH